MAQLVATLASPCYDLTMQFDECNGFVIPKLPTSQMSQTSYDSANSYLPEYSNSEFQLFDDQHHPCELFDDYDYLRIHRPSLDDGAALDSCISGSDPPPDDDDDESREIGSSEELGPIASAACRDIAPDDRRILADRTMHPPIATDDFDRKDRDFILPAIDMLSAQIQPCGGIVSRYLDPCIYYSSFQCMHCLK
jgi:hypothetical protein